mgnify:CR=1 FL=1
MSKKKIGVPKEDLLKEGYLDNDTELENYPEANSDPRLYLSQILAMEYCRKMMMEWQQKLSNVMLEAGLDPSKVYQIYPDGRIELK